MVFGRVVRWGLSSLWQFLKPAKEALFMTPPAVESPTWPAVDPSRPEPAPADRQGLAGGDGHGRSAAYQRARLWIGIGGIGSVLVVLWILGAAGLPRWMDWMLADVPGWMGGGIAGLLLGLLAGGVQLGFDVAAGRVERRYGQRLTEGEVVRGFGYWAGLLVWIGQAGLAGVVLGVCWWLAGPGWSMLASLLGVGYVLAAWSLQPGPRGERVLFQPDAGWLAGVMGELGRRGLRMPEVGWFDHGERSLAGGWAGAGRRRVLHLSTTVSRLRPEVAAGLIARELGHDRLGHRMATVLGSALLLVAGLQVGGLLQQAYWPGAGAGGVVVVGAVAMTTLSWLSLFVVPAVGRRQVLAADRFLLETGFALEEALAVLDALAEANLPDERLGGVKTYVFHPIPPMSVRREAFRQHAGVGVGSRGPGTGYGLKGA